MIKEVITVFTKAKLALVAEDRVSKHEKHNKTSNQNIIALLKYTF